MSILLDQALPFLDRARNRQDMPETSSAASGSQTGRSHPTFQLSPAGALLRLDPAGRLLEIYSRRLAAIFDGADICAIDAAEPLTAVYARLKFAIHAGRHEQIRTLVGRLHPRIGFVFQQACLEKASPLDIASINHAIINNHGHILAALLRRHAE